MGVARASAASSVSLVNSSQQVGSQVEVVFDGFGDNASFRKLDVADPGKADPRSFPAEPKRGRRRQLVHWTSEEEGNVEPADRPGTQESILEEIKIFMKRAS